MTKPAKQVYEFGSFRIDASQRLLLRSGEVVQIGPKLFEVLLVLVQNSGRVLDKDELIEKVWPDTFVEEGNLARNISTLRKILGENQEGHYIETIPRRGYRFAAAVKEVSDDYLLVRELSRVTIEQEEYSDARQETAVCAGESDEPAGSNRLEQMGNQLQSGRSLAGGEALPVASSSSAAAPTKATARGRRLLPILVCVAIVAAFGVGIFMGRHIERQTPPSFQRLTFRRGNLSRARLTPDGQTIIYAATWEGRSPELFMTRLGNPESRSLRLPSADILSISSSGMMAILLVTPEGHLATLAEVSLAGEEPRKILENVSSADWASDGKSLAVVHHVEGRPRIEFPIGKVIYEGPDNIIDIRFSPKGDRIAFIERPARGRSAIAVVDLASKKQTLSQDWQRLQGLCWSASGDEIWFTASGAGNALALYAVDLAGKQRLVARVPGKITIQDASQDGRVLLEHDTIQFLMMCLPLGGAGEQNLSWLDESIVRDLSADGKTILFNERGEGGGKDPAIYIRGTDGSPAVRLGEGVALGLSPDGKWVLALISKDSTQRLAMLPTGAGETKVLERGEIETYQLQATWFPDGKRILFAGAEPNRRPRLYAQDVAGGKPQAILSEEVSIGPLSPDGKSLVARGPDGKYFLYPLEGGEPRAISGIDEGSLPIRWSNDGRAIYLASFRRFPARIYRLDLSTGRSEFHKEIIPADADWLSGISGIQITPDGRSYVYSYSKILSTLYLADGLR